MIENFNIVEYFKFILNGLAATFVHFIFLLIFAAYTPLNYGTSNFISYIFGSTSSFLGNKFLVFNHSQDSKAVFQLAQFIVLYAFLGLNHGFALYFWADVYGFNFILGFFMITVVNTIISFLINKFLIFGSTK